MLGRLLSKLSVRYFMSDFGKTILLVYSLIGFHFAYPSLPQTELIDLVPDLDHLLHLILPMSS